MIADTTHFLSDGLFRCSSNQRRHSNMDMDVVKIEQKIKKIHARKKHKENFKKIEELENIYHSPPKTPLGLSPEESPLGSKEGFQEALSTSENFNYVVDMGSEGIALAFHYFNVFINDVFLYIPEKSRETIHQYSREINKQFSVENKEIKEKDSKVMTNVVMNLLIFPLCVLITYNWFYLNIMYDEVAFKQAEKITHDHNSVPFRYASDANRLTIDWGKDDFLNFFLYFTIKPLELVDSFLFGDYFRLNINIYFLTPEENFDSGKSKIPFTMPNIFYWISFLHRYSNGIIPSRLINKLIIFFCSIAFMYQFNFFSVVVDSLDNTKTTVLKMLCLLVILVFYFYYTFMYIRFYITRKIQLNTAFAIKGAMIGFTWAFIYATVRLTIALASVNFSALIVTLYLWFHLIFGVFIYDKDNQGFMASFDKINKFIDEEIMSSSQQCYEGGEFDKVSKFIQYVLILLNDNLISFGLLFILYTSYLDTESNITSVTVKYGFAFLLLVIAVINILMFIFPNIIKLFSKDKADYKVANHPEIYVAPGGKVLNADTYRAPTEMDELNRTTADKPAATADKPAATAAATDFGIDNNNINDESAAVPKPPGNAVALASTDYISTNNSASTAASDSNNSTKKVDYSNLNDKPYVNDRFRNFLNSNNLNQKIKNYYTLMKEESYRNKETDDDYYAKIKGYNQRLIV